MCLKYMYTVNVNASIGCGTRNSAFGVLHGCFSQDVSIRT